MCVVDFVADCQARGLSWIDQVALNDLLYSKVSLNPEQWRPLSRFEDFRAYVEGLGIETGTWYRSLNKVWFDRVDDAILFKLSLP